jgi:uncharacterized linocin/CFP29 family protein
MNVGAKGETMDNDTQGQWTEEQWNLVQQTVRDEARKVRVAASFLPVHGPLPPDAESVPLQTVIDEAVDDPTKYSIRQRGESEERLLVDDTRTRPLTTIAVNVYLRRSQVAQPDLSSPLIMFRRAANIIARVEDWIVFRGQPQLPKNLADIKVQPPIFNVAGGESFDGLVKSAKSKVKVPVSRRSGADLVGAVVRGIANLEDFGHLGPFALVLGPELFVMAYTPEKNSLVLPADRIKPLLDGPLLRSSTIADTEGVLVSLAGELIDLLVASDISVRLLQESLEPRYVYRVSQRFTLRIKKPEAIVALQK